MTDAGLVVVYRERTVARLVVDQGRFAVTYDAAWLRSPDAFPISLSLPLREALHDGASAHAFFANLLPEGGVRQAVCSRLGISVDNDVALLRAIGGECAGALSIVEPGWSAGRREAAYEEIDAARLAALTARDVVPLLLGGPPTRLSLAGAQDKLPVAVIDGALHLPLEGAPSTHILKLPNPRYAHLTLNEAFVMGLADAVGLEVAPVEVVTATDPPCLLVTRFDRHGETEIERLHQEDICQALGLPPTQKYEQEGGPTLGAALEVVRDHVTTPIPDVQRLLAWQAFNVVAGNADGHGKNLALLYEGRGLRLAPFYDLVCTQAYPALDRHLAMSIGGRRDPAQLHRAQWEALAREIDVAPRVVVQIAHDVATRVGDTIAEWTKEFRRRNGRRAILETLPRLITRNARRLVRELAPPGR